MTEMVRSVHTEQVDGSCLSVLSSCFGTKRKGRSPVANSPSEETSPRKSGIRTPQPETSLPAAKALGTTSPNPSGTANPPVENEESTQTQEDDLWQKAFEKLDEVTKKQISEDFGQSGDEGSVKTLICIVQDHEARFKEGSAKIKVGERVIIWRDYAARVVNGLTILGDIAIQFAPTPSPIIWSALKVLLKVHVRECESLTAMLGCATQVLPLVRCGAVYERVYLEDISDEFHESAINLREALVDLYAKILQLLAHAKHDLKESGARRFLHAIVHPGEGEESIQDLDKAEKQLSFVVQACEAVQTKGNKTEARKLLQSLDKPLRHIDEGVKAILDTVSAHDRSKMLDTFSSVAFGDQHLRRTKSRTEGTGQWLLRHQKFHDWETSSSSSILWLTGQMGAGKSILASNVVDRYWVEDTSQCELIDEGFAFFYYSKNDQELKGDPVAHILGSFLRQLATVPHYPKQVYTGLIELRRHMDEKKVTFDAKRCKETLSQLVDRLPRTFILLDGLDEFEKPEDVEEIVRFFIRLVENSERPVKVFISSREETYISHELLEAKQTLAQITIYDENQPDIKEFVQKRTEEIGCRWGWETEIKQEVETTLCKGARGMFRWAYLQIEQLATIKSPEGVLERLKSLPQGLKEAYDELYNANSGWDQIRLKRAVMWVMYARAPLSTQQLLSAVQLGQKSDEDELRLDIASRINESALENICRHLIVKDSRDNWKFSHASVEEYFRGEKHKSWISDDAQVELAKLSLLLLIEIFHDGPLPEAEDEAKALVDRARGDGKAQDPVISLKSYVARNWVSHIRAIHCEVDECTSISRLLKRFMIAQDGPYYSSAGYQTWALYVYLRNHDSTDDGLLFGYDLKPTQNPAFGIVAMGLHTIAKQWGEDCLKLILVNLNERRRDLLSLAARYGHSELCGKLIQWGSDVNRTLPSGSNALVEAVRSGQTACTSKLLKYGADPDAIRTTGSFACALEAAAYWNRLDAAEMLIEAGATMDVRTNGYGSPLAAAAYRGSMEVVKLLISHGADVNIHSETSRYGGVLGAAFVGHGGVNMIVYLIEEAGADPHRIISDLSARKLYISDSTQGRLSLKRDIARYLYSHTHVTLDELRSLEVGDWADKVFPSDFLSSL
ncbi:hypothetical protein F5B21DRAFT_495696 [Xylaria acuta]|nr:hypothetical protein F5B21DRAFT_495696 [Xylaria acuta]